MKIFKLMAIVLVAMVGFIACDKHECNGHNHSADLVGTWTCLTADYAEALVIKADGSALSTGVENGEMWENVAGNIVVKDGKITMTFEDNDNFTGHFDIIPGESFSIFTDENVRYTYQYCKEDLSEEIVGMWVCNDGSSLVKDGMAIQTFSEDGKAFLTTASSVLTGNQVVTGDVDYKVAGDLMFHFAPEEAVAEGVSPVLVTRLMYVPKGNTLGDMMYLRVFLSVNGTLIESTSSWLRVNECLNLAGRKYDYSNIFVTNVKGTDKDIQFFNSNFNFAKMDNSVMDKFMKATLFNIQFPDANTIEYNFLYVLSGNYASIKVPIVVEGNKVTIKMSATNSVYRDIVVYAFQDADGCQFHMYMPTKSFENFFGNMLISQMSEEGQLDLADAAAVKGIFENIESLIKTINVSIVMEDATKAKAL